MNLKIEWKHAQPPGLNNKAENNSGTEKKNGFSLQRNYLCRMFTTYKLNHRDPDYQQVFILPDT